MWFPRYPISGVCPIDKITTSFSFLHVRVHDLTVIVLEPNLEEPSIPGLGVVCITFIDVAVLGCPPFLTALGKYHNHSFILRQLSLKVDIGGV